MITARRHEADTDHSIGGLLLFGGFYLQINTILYPGKTDNEEKRLKIACREYNNEARHYFVCLLWNVAHKIGEQLQLKSFFQHMRLTSLRNKEYARP